jgi:hypothetical protein
MKVAPDQFWLLHGVTQPCQMYEVISAKPAEQD